MKCSRFPCNGITVAAIMGINSDWNECKVGKPIPGLLCPNASIKEMMVALAVAQM